MHASNRERGKIKVSITDMESKLVGEISNLAILIKANITEPVKRANKTNDLDLTPPDILVNSKAGSSHVRPHLQKSLAANFDMKTPRVHASAFVKTPHGPQHTFTFEDIVYSTKMVDWNLEEEVYYHYADVKGNIFQVCPCAILARIDTEPVTYSVMEEPYEERDSFEMQHSQLYCIKSDELSLNEQEGI